MNRVRRETRIQVTDPHTYLSLGSHIPLGKLAPPSPVNQNNIFTPKPPTMWVLRTKDLGLSPPLPLPPLPLPPLPLALAALAMPCLEPVHFSPTSAKPVLFHENLSLINPAYMLLGLLVCTSLLYQQEEPGFSCNKQLCKLFSVKHTHLTAPNHFKSFYFLYLVYNQYIQINVFVSMLVISKK